MSNSLHQILTEHGEYLKTLLAITGEEVKEDMAADTYSKSAKSFVQRPSKAGKVALRANAGTSSASLMDPSPASAGEDLMDRSIFDLDLDAPAAASAKPDIHVPDVSDVHDVSDSDVHDVSNVSDVHDVSDIHDVSEPDIPTQPDTFSTECDSDSWEDTVPDAGKLDDDTDLCCWFAPPPVQNEDPMDMDSMSSSSWDTQLTQNEDPMDMERRRNPPPLPTHWSEDEVFIKSVDTALEDLLLEPWLDLNYFSECPWGFEENLVATIAFIKERVAPVYDEYKIGICWNVEKRFFNKRYGYVLEGFQKMFALYTAPVSNPWKPGSTGQMERRLCDEFRFSSGCLNKAKGGENHNQGPPPYFVYLVVR